MASGNKMDGNVIRNLGIQSYLDNRGAQSTSNIDFFASQREQISNWKQCNFGCHTPSYRILKRQATYAELINFLGKASPLLAGGVDGSYQTVRKIVSGAERTEQGLGLEGMDRIEEIGEENTLVFRLAKSVIVKLFSVDINLLENPITEMVVRVIETYTAAIPQPIMNTIIEQGKLKFDEIDMFMVLQAIQKGLTHVDTAEGISSVSEFLQKNHSPIEQMIGKHIGKKVATYVAVIVAIQIAKQIAITISHSQSYQNFLKSRAASKNAKGLAGVAVSLLKFQGTLQIASRGSMGLKSKCPVLWSQLRDRGGLDLLYFLIEDYVTEYVDRISLAERNPTMFVQMINSLIRANGDANNIFFPFDNAKSKPVSA